MSKEKGGGSDRFHDRERREKQYQDQLPGEDEEQLPPPVEPIHADEKAERNDPCPCGSGKKYKKCCGKPQQA
ncbi:MAG: SEC-C metal-binding domain-containing protein [Planctomycetota bacterium]|jgi:preprotein translocase subunit SecA